MSQRILFVPLEFGAWANASHWPYPIPSLVAGKDSVGDVPANLPLLPNIERLKYQNPRQRPRPPFLKKPPEKNKHKPDDQHKVDDYA